MFRFASAWGMVPAVVRPGDVTFQVSTYASTPITLRSLECLFLQGISVLTNSLRPMAQISLYRIYTRRNSLQSLTFCLLTLDDNALALTIA